MQIISTFLIKGQGKNPKLCVSSYFLIYTDDGLFKVSSELMRFQSEWKIGLAGARNKSKATGKYEKYGFFL